MSGEDVAVNSLPSLNATVFDSQAAVTSTTKATSEKPGKEESMGTGMDSRGESSSPSYAPITVGICAMNKKVYLLVLPATYPSISC